MPSQKHVVLINMANKAFWVLPDMSQSGTHLAAVRVAGQHVEPQDKPVLLVHSHLQGKHCFQLASLPICSRDYLGSLDDARHLRLTATL